MSVVLALWVQQLHAASGYAMLCIPAFLQTPARCPEGQQQQQNTPQHVAGICQWLQLERQQQQHHTCSRALSIKQRKVRPCTDTATLDVPSLTDTTPAAHPHMHGYNTYLGPRGPLLLALQECNTPVCTRTPVGPGGTCTHPFGPLTAQHEMPNSTMSPTIGTTQISHPYIQRTHRRNTVK